MEEGGVTAMPGWSGDSWPGTRGDASGPCGPGDAGLLGGGHREDARGDARSGGWGSGAERREEPGRGFGRRSECLGESWGEGKATRPLPGRPGLQDETGRGDRRRKSGGDQEPPGRSCAAARGPQPTERRPRAQPGGDRRRRGTYWGPSARRSWGCPPAGEGRGSPGRPGGPGSGRTGRWSRPWLRGARLGHSPHLAGHALPPATPPPSPHRLSHQGRGHPAGSCQRTRGPRPRAAHARAGPERDAPGRVT